LNFRLGALLAAAVLIAMTRLAAADPAGLWREKGGDTIRVYTCEGGYCATLASVNPPLDAATGKPRTDKNNPDASRRNRPLVGVVVLSSMHPSGPGRWSGQLYDVDRGVTLTGNLVEVDASTIRIEGCLFGICGGENLQRVAK
jgi:uncharacterized protein (DUF2147 family)